VKRIICNYHSDSKSHLFSSEVRPSKNLTHFSYSNFEKDWRAVGVFCLPFRIEKFKEIFEDKCNYVAHKDWGQYDSTLMFSNYKSLVFLYKIIVKLTLKNVWNLNVLTLRVRPLSSGCVTSLRLLDLYARLRFVEVRNFIYRAQVQKCIMFVESFFKTAWEPEHHRSLQISLMNRPKLLTCNYKVTIKVIIWLWATFYLVFSKTDLISCVR